MRLMVIIGGKGVGKQISIPVSVTLHTNALTKGMKPCVLLTAMGKLYGRLRSLSIGSAASVGEEKPWIQTITPLKIKSILHYIIGSLAKWYECSPMVREPCVQSQVASYQRLYKWYLIPPCSTLSNIRYVSRVKWSNSEKRVLPCPTRRCSSYWKISLMVALVCGHQLYLHPFRSWLRGYTIFSFCILYSVCVVQRFVPRDFRYRRGIKDVVFLKQEGSTRFQSVVRPTSDVTTLERDL